MTSIWVLTSSLPVMMRRMPAFRHSLSRKERPLDGPYIRADNGQVPDQIISASSALTSEGRLAPAWIRLSGEHIVESRTGEPPEQPDLHIGRGVLSPGFVDVHTHGGGGASFTEGVSPARTALDSHRRHGTTTMLASLVSAPLEEVLAQAEALRPLINSDELAGVHCEGPWISPDHRGAHDERVLSAPTQEAVTALLEHPAAALVRYITLAPEHDGGPEAIGRLHEAGVVVGVGHSGAGPEQTRQALAHGASAGTHLYNGMRGLTHRDPGPALPLLQDPQVFLELICDGVHVHPEMIRFTWEYAAGNGGADRIVLVSDAMAAAAADDGDYMLGSVQVRVRQGVARRVGEDGSPGAIAGSTLTLSRAVRYCITQAGIDPEQALSSATSAPAAMAGLDDVGRLAPGCRANLTVLDESWRVERVMHRGRWVDDAGE